jgi:hypothetical protein
VKWMRWLARVGQKRMQLKYSNPYEMGTREYELFELGVVERYIGTDALKSMPPRHVRAYLRGEFSVPFKERLKQDTEWVKNQKSVMPDLWDTSFTAPTPNTTTAPQASTSTKTEATASDVDMSLGETNYLYSSNHYPPHDTGISVQTGSDFISHKQLASNTGIERLLLVQEWLESSGLYPVDSITIRFNVFDSGIQEIILSSRSGGFATERQLSSATNSE